MSFRNLTIFVATLALAAGCSPPGDATNSGSDVTTDTSQILSGTKFKNITWQSENTSSDRTMGLHVVVFEPKNDCMSVYWDGAYYDPVFLVSDPKALNFGDEALVWTGQEFQYGTGIYAPGMAKGQGPVSSGCHGQTILISSLSNE